jgi:hypothetical protein
MKQGWENLPENKLLWFLWVETPTLKTGDSGEQVLIEASNLSHPLLQG